VIRITARFSLSVFQKLRQILSNSVLWTGKVLRERLPEATTSCERKT
jgi:hypothetical protein